LTRKAPPSANATPPSHTSQFSTSTSSQLFPGETVAGTVGTGTTSSGALTGSGELTGGIGNGASAEGSLGATGGWLSSLERR